MKERSGIHKALDTTGYILSCVLLAVILIIAVAVLVTTIHLEMRTHARVNLHYYLAVGFVAFFTIFLIPRLRGNFRWLMKFTHEFTHLVFAILFFRKIERFKVDKQDSYVSYSNGWFGYYTITLSPYCVPLFTFALLPWLDLRLALPASLRAAAFAFAPSKPHSGKLTCKVLSVFLSLAFRFRFPLASRLPLQIKLSTY